MKIAYTGAWRNKSKAKLQNVEERKETIGEKGPPVRINFSRPDEN